MLDFLDYQHFCAFMDPIPTLPFQNLEFWAFLYVGFDTEVYFDLFLG